MQQTHSLAANFGYPPQRVADLLAVGMSAESQLSSEMGTLVTSCPHVGLGADHLLDSLLQSVSPVSDARSELVQLDHSVLLAGFEIWGERQRAVVRKLAASAAESQ